MPALPIEEALPALRAALAARSVAVLEAPPGAGKTTRVPLALIGEPWLGGQRLVMLEPRRLAARAAAHYMARLLGESVGGTVGYRVRGETRVSVRTRIEVVTEGVLARLLSADATLDGYGAVLFDEFHERSLQGDLGLALVLETQQQLRDDLRVLVMSATLDGDAVAALLADAQGSAPVVRSAGRMYPITTHYRPPRSDERLDAATSRVVREALADSEGDVLVFLPGMGEQRRVAERLEGDTAMAAARVRVHVLHGSMPLTEQDAALAPAPPGARKVVLSTSVAETSLTVEGVRVVVDAGLSRVPRFDATAGLTRMHTVRVSRASADQRRGRAGRVAPGV
ncbi:MAG: helicase-related protein, partial [Gemmatimonadaceae bacterium]